MLYEVPEPYSPPHQLVFISGANKRLGSTIEQYLSHALHSHCVLHLIKNYKNNYKKNLSLNLHTSEELTKMLQ